jgi:pimeloyl-ACP methyl ester carboxylesterase
MVGVPGQEVLSVPTLEGRMAVEIRGPRKAGPPVVCLHGLSANRATWEPVADRLRHRRFILVDLLGRGQSDAARVARYDLESEAQRVILVLQALGLQSPILAGHSHGAAVAVAAASGANALGLLLVNPVTPELSRPAALTALKYPAVRSLVAPALRLFRRSLTRYMLVRRVFADGAAVPAGVVDRYAAPWADAERSRCLPTILSDWDPAELERFAAPPGVPVHVYAGAEDRRIDPGSARRWAATLGGTFSLAAGCGHSAPEERATEVAMVLEDLVTAICAREQEETRDDQE